MRGTSRTARPHPQGHRDKGRADRNADKHTPAHKRTVQSELGGQATTSQIVSELRGRNGPSTRQVAVHLRTRRDVEQETLANRGIRWQLDPEVRP